MANLRPVLNQLTDRYNTEFEAVYLTDDSDQLTTNDAENALVVL